MACRCTSLRIRVDQGGEDATGSPILGWNVLRRTAAHLNRDLSSLLVRIEVVFLRLLGLALESGLHLVARLKPSTLTVVSNKAMRARSRLHVLLLRLPMPVPVA